MRQKVSYDPVLRLVVQIVLLEVGVVVLLCVDDGAYARLAAFVGLAIVTRLFHVILVAVHQHGSARHALRVRVRG